MNDPLTSDGTLLFVDTLPPGTPAERLQLYICAKLAEKHLVLLQIHTGPHQYHFGSITQSITPLKEGYHDYYIPVTSLDSASNASEVVKDILSARGIPTAPDPNTAAAEHSPARLDVQPGPDAGGTSPVATSNAGETNEEALAMEGLVEALPGGTSPSNAPSDDGHHNSEDTADETSSSKHTSTI